MRVSILHGKESLLATVNPDPGFPGLCVEISSKGSYMQLNERFLNRGVFEMLEGENLSCSGYCIYDNRD